jgi:hypothetical protein
MEEILTIIFQAAFEVLLEFFTYWPFDLWGSNRDTGGKPSFWCWIVVYTLLGLGVGSIINLIHPQTFIHSSTFRMLNLAISPFCSGYIAYKISQMRLPLKPQIKPGRHFFFALSFTFGIAFIRFIYATR